MTKFIFNTDICCQSFSRSMFDMFSTVYGIYLLYIWNANYYGIHSKYIFANQNLQTLRVFSPETALGVLIESKYTRTCKSTVSGLVIQISIQRNAMQLITCRPNVLESTKIFQNEKNPKKI